MKLRRMRTEGGRAMVAYLRRHLRGHIQYYGVSGNSRTTAKYAALCSSCTWLSDQQLSNWSPVNLT
jgi:hypothetical protein